MMYKVLLMSVVNSTAMMLLVAVELTLGPEICTGVESSSFV